ncbi:MarR family transcriptional regulator [Kutzneria chonburiensis]|uniref:MarR family transcriptional regulator n=1 Tax=Kutzneria chonburiensis TaxID=1483604 RepID=A0ABV6MTJ0_9PSEU|nr:MarR family transcriptional regulator [Kutzneria chonburiensis]
MTQDVLAELGLVVQAYQAAVDDFDRENARLLGVNGTDLRCLELLLGAGELTPRELGERLNLTTGSVTAMLDRLERLDLLSRAPHPTDRRKVVVRMTKVGAGRCLDQIRPLLAEGQQELAARYSTEQLLLVIDFLRTSTALQQRHVERLRAAKAS